MKTKSQLSESIIAIALLMVAVVCGLSGQEITHTSAAVIENQNKPAKEKKGGTNRPDNSNQAEHKNQNSNRNPDGNRNQDNPKDGDGTGANANSTIRSTGTGSTNSSVPPSIDEVNRTLKALDEKSIKRDDLWPLDVVVNPIGLSLIILAVILGLFLHVIQFIRLTGINSKITRLATIQNNLIHSVRTNTGQPVDPISSNQALNAVVDKVADQVNQLQQGINNLTKRCNQIDNQITVSDSQYRDAAHGIEQVANWIGQAQLKAGMAASGGELSESERAAAIAMLERYREPLRSNANRVEPITDALRELSEKLQYRSHSSPQVAHRIQHLYHGIAQFERQISQVTTELESLYRGSFAKRSARLQTDQDRLIDQVNNGSLSLGQMVQQSRSLIERHFPAEQKSRTDQNLSLEEQEANLKKGIDEAGDYLMDWYNNLFQLQAQLGQVQGSQADAETAGELARIKELAREALNRFDIQPEAIQIGQTSFDRRLHEATLVRQAPQYPVNTVIDVQKCGFRRMTTGEVLRRPEVVVAGTAT